MYGYAVTIVLLPGAMQFPISNQLFLIPRVVLFFNQSKLFWGMGNGMEGVGHKQDKTAIYSQSYIYSLSKA